MPEIFALVSGSTRPPSPEASPTYFVSVIERHIRSDAARSAGVRDVPLGRVAGPRAVVEAKLTGILAAARPDEVHEIHLYEQDAEGVNRTPILSGAFTGCELPQRLTDAGW